MAESELVNRILSEADMAARPGQYDRLVAIANEVAALSAEIDRMVGELSSIHHLLEQLARDATEAHQ
jgi:uncharacterized coiled-coil DUF342 family protein